MDIGRFGAMRPKVTKWLLDTERLANSKCEYRVSGISINTSQLFACTKYMYSAGRRVSD